MYVHRTPAWLKKFYPTLEWDRFTDQKELFLTFDDGPVPGVTQYVLEELEKYQAKATFFCVGHNISKHRSVFEEVLARGHSVGNHTFSHLNGWKTEDTIYGEDVIRCQDLISPDSFQGKPLFRPPYGRIKKSQIRLLQKDFRVVMWDLLSGDFDKDLLPGKCLETSLRLTRKGSIIIFHDSYKAEKSLRHTLPRYLEHFSEKGFRFCSL